jgi:single-strand DNA-binding protein
MSNHDLNQCNFIGNLGQDPETRALPDGTLVCNFSIACGWKTSTKEGTEWVRVSTFGKLAEICDQYLDKGSKVFISGSMRTRKWQDNSGADRYTTEIAARDMQMLSARNLDQQPAPNNPNQPAQAHQAPRQHAPQQAAQRQAPQQQAPQQGYQPRQRGAQHSPPSDNFEDDDVPF